MRRSPGLRRQRQAKKPAKGIPAPRYRSPNDHDDSPSAPPSMHSLAPPDGVDPSALTLAGDIVRQCKRGVAAEQILPRVEHLAALLRDPHDFLHDYVSVNWEHAALLSLIDTGVLDQLSAVDAPAVSVQELSAASRVPCDKLLRLLRLLSCRHIVCEPEPGYFRHAAISTALVAEPSLRAWVAFQLFETRVAGAHLANSLKAEPNGYGTNVSAFHHAFGSEMYDWHSAHPNQGKRFALAMQGVSQSLDPADHLFASWFSSPSSNNAGHVIEIGGRYGFASAKLVERFPNHTYEVTGPSTVLKAGQATLASECNDKITFTPHESYWDYDFANTNTSVRAIVIRNVLWNWSDHDAISLLRTMIPLLRSSNDTSILVCDGVSPEKDAFAPSVEIAYRRRDVTMMTMHNVKQRTQAEWINLFRDACPDFKISSRSQASSHVLKGLWELRMGD